MAQGYFVTGTDTGVGKTTISCALLRAFAAQGRKAVGMKPVVAGSENGRWHDVEQLIAASNINAAREYVNPYAFDPPVSPHIAAQQAGVEIDLAVIQRAYQALSSQADIVIVGRRGRFSGAAQCTANRRGLGARVKSSGNPGGRHASRLFKPRFADCASDPRCPV
jgi:dethiobiotin synthetase